MPEPTPTVPAYTSDELAARIGDGSVDMNRLAATVARMQDAVTALATWANAQIQQQQTTAAATTTGNEQAEAETSKRRK